MCIFNGEVSQQCFKGWPSIRRHSYPVGNTGAGILGVAALSGSNFSFTLLPLIPKLPSLQLSLVSLIFLHLPNYVEARKPCLIDHTPCHTWAFSDKSTGPGARD